jgi:predicted transcriptional regulator
LDQARNQLYHADSRLQELEEECKGLHQQLLFEQNQIRPSLRHDLNPSYDDLLRIATTLARVKSSSLSESCDYQIEKLTQLQNQLEVALVNVKLSRTETECRQAMLKLQQEQQLKSSEDASICCICRDQLRSILLLPCRHFCLCEECSHGILIDDNRASSSYMTSTMINCPVCRQRITGKMKIFS